MAEARRTTRREERWNAWLTLGLLAVLVVAANLLAKEHLRARFDLSQDRLYSVAPAARALLGRIPDHLHVKAFFTQNVRNGELALAKARLIAMLEEYEALARGRMRVDVVDPEGSSEALLEAEQYGLTPYESRTRENVVEVTQRVYLGLVLRARGREQAIPFVLPATLETRFCQHLDNLLRDRATVVGWLGGASDAVPGGRSFARARDVLARRHEVRPVEGLESGQPVPEDVDLLVVVAPDGLHPRAAFEIDQHVQRGGRLLVCVDQRLVSLRTGTVQPVERTGVEELLATWGARVTPEHVWDDQNAPLRYRRRVGGESGGFVQEVLVDYPLFVRLDASSFDASLPPVAGQQRGLLPWVQPIEPTPPPDGVRRSELVQSSANAYRVPLVSVLDPSEEHVTAQSRANYAQGPGRRYALAVALDGRLPSPFVDGAPARWDPFGGSDGGTTDEPVLSAASDAQVVVFGDADWMSDEYVQANEELLANVVDWLVLEDDLLALRARTPRARPLRDDYAEELRRRGLAALPADETLAALDERLRAESAAMRAARARRWRVMLVPVGISLALVLGGGAWWNARGRRRAQGAER